MQIKAVFLAALLLVFSPARAMVSDGCVAAIEKAGRLAALYAGAWKEGDLPKMIKHLTQIRNEIQSASPGDARLRRLNDAIHGLASDGLNWESINASFSVEGDARATALWLEDAITAEERVARELLSGSHQTVGMNHADQFGLPSSLNGSAIALQYLGDSLFHRLPSVTDLDVYFHLNGEVQRPEALSRSLAFLGKVEDLRLHGDAAVEEWQALGFASAKQPLTSVTKLTIDGDTSGEMERLGLLATLNAPNLRMLVLNNPRAAVIEQLKKNKKLLATLPRLHINFLGKDDAKEGDAVLEAVAGLDLKKGEYIGFFEGRMTKKGVDAFFGSATFAKIPLCSLFASELGPEPILKSLVAHLPENVLGLRRKILAIHPHGGGSLSQIFKRVGGDVNVPISFSDYVGVHSLPVPEPR
jgi:hypothetical protein